MPKTIISQDARFVKLKFYIGLDDTDNAESRGTGHLARQIAAELARDYHVHGVSRHQLLFDPRVPYTKHNSSAAIILEAERAPDAREVLERVRRMMLADFQPGSDPGLCVASEVPAEVTEFGRLAQHARVKQGQARGLANRLGIALAGLGGTEDGVIGALSAVGLAASGDDGRYVLVGGIRELKGLQPVTALLAAGVAAVQTMDGQLVTEGLVACEKLRPARRCGRPIAVVEWNSGHWLPLKLD
jgi:hypothetical protein